MPFPAIKTGLDKLLGIDGAAEDTWFAIRGAGVEDVGDTGPPSTWFCCAPAATAYPDTGGGGVLNGAVFCTGSSPLLDS